jgi:SAM-dependent methyltransferase
MSTRPERVSPRQVFDLLASDYYDEDKHPTTASFRSASDHLLRGWLARFIEHTTIVCEVGAGKSSVTPFIGRGCDPPGELLLIDFSFGMLRHSALDAWSAHRILADAERLPLKSGTIDLLVAPLGAPFNRRTFWQEAARVVRAGCHVIYTGPAHEWARAFRNGNPVADFGGGDEVLRVPSWTRTQDDQRRLTGSLGFETVEEGRVRLSEIRQAVPSSKLSASADEDPVVVAGVVVRKTPG